MGNSRVTDRCPTGIDELDEILNGGFPRGAVILVAGHPGAGKTLFAAKFLYEGVRKYGEPGLYLSLAEDERDFMRYTKQIGMNFEELEKEGMFKFVGLPVVADASAVAHVIERLVDNAISVGARRVVIDGISALAQILGPAKTRSLLHSTIGRGLKALSATTILIADMPYGTSTVGAAVEEFVVDGVMVFRYERARGGTRRVMEIRKMRGTRVPVVEIPFMIVPSTVIKLLTVERPERLIGFGKELLTTGDQELDRMLGGGILKGAQVLITGPSGSGKTLLCINIALANVMKNKRVMYISFEEPPAQLESLLDRITKEWREKELKIVSINTTMHTFESLTHEIVRLIEEYRPDLVVIDGEAHLVKLGSEYDYWLVSVNMYITFKKYGITCIHTYAANYPEERVGVDTLADTIISLKIVKEGGKYIRKLAVLKNRNNVSSNEEVYVGIKENGIVFIKR